jgi:hypothetical protein
MVGGELLEAARRPAEDRGYVVCDVVGCFMSLRRSSVRLVLDVAVDMSSSPECLR